MPLNKIIIRKQPSKTVMRPGGTVRISEETSDLLEQLAEESGIVKTRLADFLLKRALKAVVLIEPDCEVNEDL